MVLYEKMTSTQPRRETSAGRPPWENNRPSSRSGLKKNTSRKSGRACLHVVRINAVAPFFDGEVESAGHHRLDSLAREEKRPKNNRRACVKSAKRVGQ